MKFVLAIVFLLSTVFVATKAAECGQNEQYLLCQPCAAINCGDVAPEICIEVCQNAGCYCAPGFLRKGSVCVPTSRC